MNDSNMQLYVVPIMYTWLYYKIVHNHVEINEFVVLSRRSIYSVHDFCPIFLSGSISVLENQVKFSFKLEKNHILISRSIGSAVMMNLVSFQGTYRPVLMDVETAWINNFDMVDVPCRKLELQGIPKKVTIAFLPRQICVPLYVKICNTLLK